MPNILIPQLMGKEKSVIERIKYQLCKYILLVVLFLPLVAHSTIEIPINKKGLIQRPGFIENKGQIIDQNSKPNPAVLYLLNTPGMNVQLRRGGFSYDLYSFPSPTEKNATPPPLHSRERRARCESLSGEMNFHRIDFNLIGSDPDCELVISGQSQDYLNYYTTGTSVDGVTFVRSYQTVIYRNIYPYIDLEFLVDQKSGVKYSFIIHPGGKLSSIRMKITDPEIEVSSSGALMLKNTTGSINEEIPRSFYQVNNVAVDVKCRFQKTSRGIYGFCPDGLIPANATLIIDPVPDRVWSTYYGGTNNEFGYGCAVDGDGNVYISGDTQSSASIATTGAYQTTLLGLTDVFLAKFTASGVRLWATYFGGPDWEYNYNCTVDKAGNTYIAGTTWSLTNISTPGCHQPVFGGWVDCFLVKFSPDGQRIWGTYYGGTNDEQLGFVKSDDSCNIYLTGVTHSNTNISTPGSFKPTTSGGDETFLVKFDSSGQRLWGTYYGGPMADRANDCSISKNGYLYIAGTTASASGISTPGSFQPNWIGGLGGLDGYLACFNPAGQRLWGTYYGGNGYDVCVSVAADTSGNAYISGFTSSPNIIASAGSYQSVYAGNTDVFLARFSPDGTRRWGTYYGATDHDSTDVSGLIAVDDSSHVYLTGFTNSTSGIATTNSYQTAFAGYYDAFLVKFDSAGQRIWGTYYGGSGNDLNGSVAVNANGVQYLTGSTTSVAGISTTGSHQRDIGGGFDAFLVKFQTCTGVDPAQPITGPADVCLGTSGFVFTVPFIANATGYFWSLPPGFTITNGINTNAITVSAASNAVSGNISVYGTNNCAGGVPSSLSVTVHQPPIPILLGADSACVGTAILYTTDQGKSLYQWNVSPGGIAVNGGSQSDHTVEVLWNNPGIQWLSVNYTDNNGCTALLPIVKNVIVSELLTVGISITASTNNICEGTPVTFTATATNPGTNPAYQWKVNGVSAGASAPTFAYAPASGDIVKCILTSSNTVCTSNNPATSNTITMVVNPLHQVSVSISPSVNTVCEGTSVTFTANPTHGGLLPGYQWKVNAINIGGATNSTYTYLPLNGDIVTCQMTSSDNCVTGNPALSPPVTMTVNQNLEVTVSIIASANPFCAGSQVTFTATPDHGGLVPGYQWKVNGSNAGTNSPSFSYSPANGDQVSCVLNSSASCITGNPALSNIITMTVNTNLLAGVSISTPTNPFCPGTAVTFTATPVNGGSTPGYQWRVNASNISNAINAVFTYNPLPGDLVSCVMTSNLSCVTANPATSAPIAMTASNAPHVTFSPCFDTITSTNAKAFKLKGGLPIGGAYSGPGVDPVSGIFSPSIAGPGTYLITYNYTNIANCTSTAATRVFNFQFSTFNCGNPLTDIRDSKTYPTVQIGTQCWMEENLDFGFQISDLVPQTDNCVAEKFIRYSSFNVQYSTFYQWDELMRYDPTPASQGLCPPGWHVPTDAEWATLINYYQGNGSAGRPLQDTIINGFKALRSGVFYLNSTWSFMDFATIFWTSTSSGPTKAISHGMNLYNFSVSFYPASRANAFPVRCLKDM